MWTTLTSTAGGCWRNANYYCCYLLFTVLSLDLVPGSTGLPLEPWRQINNKCSASPSANTRMAQWETVKKKKVYKIIMLYSSIIKVTRVKSLKNCQKFNNFILFDWFPFTLNYWGFSLCAVFLFSWINTILDSQPVSA